MTSSAAALAAPERIGQISVLVQDVERATAFYRDVLGLRFLFEAPPQLAFFDCAGTRLMLTPPEREGAVAGQQFNSILYYTVADIQGAAQALGERGVQFERDRIGTLGHSSCSSHGGESTPQISRMERFRMAPFSRSSTP